MTNPFSKDQIKALVANLNPDRVATRSQGQSTLSYLEAYDVKATLIRVFGFGNFSSECIETKILDVKREPQIGHKGKETYEYERIQVTAICTVRLTIHATGAVYTETAASMQTGRDLGEVTDFAIKTAESDALKRAAINLGTQFGLSLYRQGTKTEDVVKIVLDPEQKALVDEFRAEVAAKQAQGQAVLQGGLKQHDAPGGASEPGEPAEGSPEAQAMEERYREEASQQ